MLTDDQGRSVFDVVEREFKCDCTETVVCYVVCSNGRKQFKRQCQCCGKCSNNLAVSTLTSAEISQASPKNDEIQKEWYAERSKRWKELETSWRAKQDSAWWQQYNEYLASDKWGKKRARVLKRDNYMCQACLSRRASEVHHLTYKHVFDEPLFELTSLCSTCHEAITRMDRREVST